MNIYLVRGYKVKDMLDDIPWAIPHSHSDRSKYWFDLHIVVENLENLMIRFVHVRGDDKYYRQHKRRGKDWKFWSIERYPRLHELNGAIDGRFC